jgi:hypothetical protein
VYKAISATEGTFTEGSIAIAERALERATAAYESAQAKLDELKAARDEFLSSLKEMAYSFVNDLSKVNEEITRFTRLDSVGSFSSVTEEVANTQSFTQGLKDRLASLKDFANNVKSLIASGLDKSLVQQIAQSGPQESGAIASALAGASKDEIADINKVQAELSQTISGMQQDASAAWFDAGIAAQEAFTAPLKAAMDAAQSQVDTLNQQKDLALGILQAWQDDQNAMLDGQEVLAKERYDKETLALKEALKANQEAAETIAAGIDKRLQKLPDSAYASGIAMIDGLIKGLSDDAKLKELKAAAAAMANEIKKTVNSVLGVNSPSTVMIYTGNMVGEGLALGMTQSEPMVAAAASSLGSLASASMSIQGPGSSGPTTVKVYLSDRELTELVDQQVTITDERSLDYVLSGRRY